MKAIVDQIRRESMNWQSTARNAGWVPPDETSPGLLMLIARIREAAGDPAGKLMQDELIERVAELRKALDASEAALKSCGATYSGLDGYGAPSRLVQHHDTVLVEIARAAIDAAKGEPHA